MAFVDSVSPVELGEQLSALILKSLKCHFNFLAGICIEAVIGPKAKDPALREIFLNVFDALSA